MKILLCELTCVNLLNCCFFLQGVMARVYEAVVLLLLLALLVLGIVWVASALLHDNLARKSLYGEF